MIWRGNQLIQRRGISTVVGTLFFLVIMIGAFVAFTTMMETNNDVFRTQLKIANKEILRIQEEYVLSACTDSDDSHRLKVFIENTGESPVEMADLFIINKTETTHNVAHYDIRFDDSFVPVGKIVNILENQELAMAIRAETYDIKVVSALGNTEIISLPVADPGERDDRLVISMNAYPDHMTVGGNVTAVMMVYNRGNHTLYDVQPFANPIAANVTNITTEGVAGPTPTLIKRLDPNEDITFTWAYKLFGGKGNFVNFTGSAKAKLCADVSTFDVHSQDDFDLIQMTRDLEPAAVGPTEPFNRPLVFTSFPYPFGASRTTSTGTFNIVVANPTNQTLLVSQLTSNLLNPSSSQITDALTGVKPDTGWAQPTTSNMWYWRSTAAPISITPYNASSFTALVEDKAPTATEEPTNVVAISVATNYGQFGQRFHNLGVYKDDTVIAEVYLDDSKHGTENKYYIPGLQGDTKYRINFTLNNNATSNNDEAILPGSFLLVNVPPGWDIFESTAEVHDGDMSASDQEFKFDTSDILIFDDGSKLLPVEVTSTGDSPPNNNAGIIDGEHGTFSILMETPAVTETQMYLFHILGNGTAQTSCAGVCGTPTIIGPVAETLIQVCPASGCGIQD